ncbi:MAG: hypothetical protein IKL08_03070 [Clostridia bacterium]|nr:hypothetical protein [Clostridia bacterium]
MKNIFNKKNFYVLLATILLIGASWLFTCGLIWLITLCFRVEFDWLTATGIWLILCLLGTVFGGSKK